MLRSGRSVFARVGSSPTACIFAFLFLHYVFIMLYMWIFNERYESSYRAYFEYCGVNRNSDRTLLVISMEIYAANMH